MTKHIVNTLHPFYENTTTKYLISISSMNITGLNWSERFQNLSLLLQFQNKGVSLFFMLTIQTYMPHTMQSWILQSQAVLTSQNIARCFADIVRPIHRGRCYMFLYACWGNSRCQNITSDLLPCSNNNKLVWFSF